MADDPGLPAGIANGGLASVRCVARGEVASAVTKNRAAPGFVVGNPVLAFGNGLEDDAGVVLVVERELGPVQQTAVPLVETVGKVPVVQCDIRLDAGLKEVINELDVVVQASLVDGIITTTKGDDAGPGEGKPVGFGAELLQQGDVVGGPVIRVAGDLPVSLNAVRPLGNLAVDLTESIPDGRAAAIFVNGTFDLVAGF